MRIMFLNQAPRSPDDGGYHERIQALLQGYASPGTIIDLCYPDDMDGGRVMRAASEQKVHTELPYTMTGAALVRKAVWAERNGYDAVIQSNNFEPGVEASRLAVRIPVIGLCRTTMLVAASLAERVGVTVPFDGYAFTARRLLRSYRLEQYVTDVRTMSLPGFNIAKEEVQARAADVMRGLVHDTGAECIVPLGGAVIPYIVDPKDLEREVGVPVLNNKSIGIHYAEMCVNLGLAHSPHTYPTAKLSEADFSGPAYG